MTDLYMELPESPYKITVGHALLARVGELLNLQRRVFIVTDTGVPEEYARTVRQCAKTAKVVTLPEGEATKCLDSFGLLCKEMLDFGMTRKDCVVAVGGGVVGDLAGFAAACYMRGIDFYNIPTTLLSQVDSSIGGKTAIDLGATKNIIGAFHQPKRVIIDIDTLKTLPKRHVAAGLAEALKMAMTSDSELFRIFEEEEITSENIETVIIRSLMIKKHVVEEDEKESGLRKILNFGHTLGHGIEASSEGSLYHGECVALGMLPMTGKKTRDRLEKIMKKLGLPLQYEYDTESALEYVSHDKKCDGKGVSAIFVDEPGAYRIENLTMEEFKNHIRENV